MALGPDSRFLAPNPNSCCFVCFCYARRSILFHTLVIVGTPVYRSIYTHKYFDHDDDVYLIVSKFISPVSETPCNVVSECSRFGFLGVGRN